MDFTINLKAGVWTRQDTRGRLFMLVDTGAAGSIELRIDTPGENDETINEARKGFRAKLNAGHFSGVLMRATVDTTAKIVISDNDIDYSFSDGVTVKAEIQGLPLPVSNDRGTPGNLMHVTGVSLADAPATAVHNVAPIACGPAAVSIAGADATRRAIRFTNLGPDPVAIGGGGLVWANRTIVLEPGDVWIEDRAANIAWTAITDAGKAASVTSQRVVA